jgi:hypothetical protein
MINSSTERLLFITSLTLGIIISIRQLTITKRLEESLEFRVSDLEARVNELEGV